MSAGGAGKPLLLVSAALIEDAAGRVLLTQRKPRAHLPLCWEFPGGKVEAGETPEAALMREMREEVGIEIADLKPWRFVSHDYATFHLLMPLFSCRIASGEPQALDVHAVAWFERDQLRALDWPPADEPLLEALLAQ
ncbi:(deoxy)nucleoside triphosphate pyrophosphohydrolase [Magnetofaba australis]|uniref:8-oxo-dGTP diphosphatase n=1 Tax=Magnetofaba australis IT-1 TaxID=1434232 RepID=A0A1Y2K3D4_9PROT|nr:(deoxy)nucleoside triphosphate pyrophosphohydrolase [Magnetofaba australis]OSM02177.1 putative NUDIX hydrolase [Magnetofaba australis IT-1]